MIVTRTPLRITLGGGGTDLPSFYERHGGYVFAMTIDKHVQISLRRRPAGENLRHPLARAALRAHGLLDVVELSSQSDLPGGTGLGSSGAYLVGLLAAIRACKREPVSARELAEEACLIEMDVLKAPGGKQDPYLAAFGGFRTLDIDRSGSVRVGSVPVNLALAKELAAKARLYDTGMRRSAGAVLRHQNAAARNAGAPEHSRVVEGLRRILEIGREIEQAFRARDLDRFAVLMDEHWAHKKTLSPGVSLPAFDHLYDHVKREYGVRGGKIIGAGGGGFAWLYCPKRGRELDEFMRSNGMPPVPYFPSPHGCRIQELDSAAGGTTSASSSCDCT